MDWEMFKSAGRISSAILPTLTSMVCLYGWYFSVSTWTPEPARSRIRWSLRYTALIFGFWLAFNAFWLAATWKDG